MTSFNIAIIHHVLLAVFLTTFIACQSDRRLDALDEAGENRPELEKVLQHYKDDKQKLQAVRFLFPVTIPRSWRICSRPSMTTRNRKTTPPKP